MFCICTNKEPLIDISNLSWGKLEVNEAVYYKRYQCSRGPNTCNRYYKYCELCEELIIGEKYAGYRHELSKHPETIWGTYWSDKKLPFSILEYPKETPAIHSMMRQLCDRNPQLPAILTVQKQIYHPSCMVDCTENELVDTINGRLYLGNYKCVICGCDYDSFPTRELVIKHLKTRPGITKLNT